MKDITRIHIAKQPYDIEITAKQDLENYIQNVEAYANDTEVVNDIEIRMTELLSERKIAPGGVIAQADVTAIRDQLGEPSDFATDDFTEPSATPAVAAGKKLYRDTEDVLLGGVLSGLSYYIKLPSALLRVIFVALFFASGSAVGVVYLLLWLIIPPAKTAAQKLEMRGTVPSIGALQAFSRTDSARRSVIKRSAAIRRVLMQGVGALCIVAAAIVLMMTVFAVIALWESFSHLQGNWGLAASGGAAAVGTLLTLLLGIVSYASFRMTLSKRALAACGTLAVLVVVTCMAGAGLAIIL